MQLTKILLTVGLSTYFLGCTSRPNEEVASMAADSSANAFISSSAAVEKNKDSTRKFVRTADLKFKVKSVVKATYDIENIAGRNGGFVVSTDLASSITNVTSTEVSSDSSLETTHYTVSNSITIRVPNTKLDTTLREIARNIDYLDYRIIKAEDVGLQVLSNNLAQKRAAKTEHRLAKAIDNRGKKLNETTSAEEVLSGKQEQADNARVENLSLTDQIKFSTINLSIYQRPTIKRELVPNYNDPGEYEPGFGTKLLRSLTSGWETLEVLVLFLARCWALFLFAALVYVVYKRYRAYLK